jgi:hypothetical protein
VILPCCDLTTIDASKFKWSDLKVSRTDAQRLTGSMNKVNLQIHPKVTKKGLLRIPAYI